MHPHSNTFSQMFFVFFVQPEKTYLNFKPYKQHDIFIPHCEPRPQLGVKSGSKTTSCAEKKNQLFLEL